MLPGFAWLSAAAQTAASADPAPDTSAPTGPPTNASAYAYAGDRVGVQWTNGDSTAETEIARTGATTVQPTAREFIVPATETAYQTGQTDRCYWWVRHRKNGQYTVWVIALHELGCTVDSDGGGDLV